VLRHGENLDRRIGAAGDRGDVRGAALCALRGEEAAAHERAVVIDRAFAIEEERARPTGAAAVWFVEPFECLRGLDHGAAPRVREIAKGRRDQDRLRYRHFDGLIAAISAAVIAAESRRVRGDVIDRLLRAAEDKELQ